MSTTTKVELKWTELWKKQIWHHPIQYGVEAALDDSKKLYKAFCTYPLDMNKPRFETPVYEACDEADPTFVLPDNYRPIQAVDRDHITAKAAIARAKMTDKQRSAVDMNRIADDLRARAVDEYSQWQRDEEEKRKRLVDDEAALKNFRHWMRGAELISEEEKATLRSILNG